IPEQDQPRGGGSYAVGKFTGARTEIAVATDNGGLIVVSTQGGTLKQTARLSTGLYQQRLFNGRFGAPGTRDLLPVGFPQKGQQGELEGRVLLAAPHSPSRFVPTPPRR